VTVIVAVTAGADAVISLSDLDPDGSLVGTAAGVLFIEAASSWGALIENSKCRNLRKGGGGGWGAVFGFFDDGKNFFLPATSHQSHLIKDKDPIMNHDTKDSHFFCVDNNFSEIAKNGVNRSHK
jgi:hypothetical protein